LNHLYLQRELIGLHFFKGAVATFRITKLNKNKTIQGRKIHTGLERHGMSK